MKECQKTFLILLGIFLALGTGGTILNIWLNGQGSRDNMQGLRNGQNGFDGQAKEEMATEEQQLIGGQRDEHGCLGPAGYQWCPSTEKCQRMWEEYCEEYQEQYKGGAGEIEDADAIVGDAGENPPENTAEWDEFESKEGHFKFQYPENYKTVIDKYGWPFSAVHLMDLSGGQSYDVTFEVWKSEDEAAAEGRYPGAAEFFGMVENPFTDKFVSMTCWNPGTKSTCEDIYETLVMLQ